MKKSEKTKHMNYASYSIDIAKDRMCLAAEYLQENGLEKDAEQLMKMIYKLEAFENKYNN